MALEGTNHRPTIKLDSLRVTLGRLTAFICRPLTMVCSDPITRMAFWSTGSHIPEARDGAAVAPSSGRVTLRMRARRRNRKWAGPLRDPYDIARLSSVTSQPHFSLLFRGAQHFWRERVNGCGFFRGTIKFYLLVRSSYGFADSSRIFLTIHCGTRRCGAVHLAPLASCGRLSGLHPIDRGHNHRFPVCLVSGSGLS